MLSINDVRKMRAINIVKNKQNKNLSFLGCHIMTDIIHDKVVVICPTYNRRFFLPTLIYMFDYQTYNKKLCHLIVLDDSDTSNSDLFDGLSEDLKFRITYIYDNKKQTIGAKRNHLNKLAKKMGANYIVCFDDDDYYPKNKISYAVQKLKESKYKICGSSKMLIYYPKNNILSSIGPFVNHIYPGHATNGTLAYHVEYLLNHCYSETDNKNEENIFLNNWSVQLLQLPSEFVIICMVHGANTVSKDSLNLFDIGFDISHFIDDENLLNFFKNLV
jgi:hypothetical protein